METSGLTSQYAAMATRNASALNLLGHSQVSQKSDVDKTNVLIASLEDSDPDKAATFKRQQTQLEQTLNQLQDSKSKAAAKKKDDARRKIEQLKAQIKALAMLAAINPKAAAKQAARLSRELAAAAHEYASATTPATTPTAAQPAATPATATAAATATGTPTDTAQTAPATPAAAEVAVSVTPGTTSAATTVAAPPAVITTAAPAVAAQPAAGGPSIADAKADGDFAKDARLLMNQLKKIVDAAKQKLQHDKNEKGDKMSDVHHAESSLNDAEASINVISTNATQELVAASAPPVAVPASVNITV